MEKGKKQLNSHMFENIYKDLNIDLDSLGCIMIDTEKIDIGEWKEKDIFYKTKNKTRKWIDGNVSTKTPHVTLLYGLLKNGNEWKKYVDQVLDGSNIKTVEIEDVSFFESPYKDEKYYCIVANIKVREELQDAHNRLEFLPHINTFDSYKPHVTIAYIKKNPVTRKLIIDDLKRKLVGKKLKVLKINYGYKK